MDVLAFVISVLVVVFALQYNQPMLAVAVALVLFAATKTLLSALLLVFVVVIYFVFSSGNIGAYFSWILFGSLFIALALGLASSEERGGFFGGF